MGVVEFALQGVDVVEEVVNAGDGVVAYLLDKGGEAGCVGGGKLAGVRIDGRDEGRCGLGEVGVEFLQILVHLGDRLHHLL